MQIWLGQSVAEDPSVALDKMFTIPNVGYQALDNLTYAEGSVRLDFHVPFILVFISLKRSQVLFSEPLPMMLLLPRLILLHSLTG